MRPRSSTFGSQSSHTNDFASCTVEVLAPPSIPQTMRSSVVGSHQVQHPPAERTYHSPNVNLDLSPEKQKAQKDVLQNAVFPNWRDDTGGADLDKPDEMEKMDPLGTQIWRLYSKQKKTMPNSERMENLSWRLMSVKLKNMKSDTAIRCVSQHALVFSS